MRGGRGVGRVGGGEGVGENGEEELGWEGWSGHVGSVLLTGRLKEGDWSSAWWLATGRIEVILSCWDEMSR